MSGSGGDRSGLREDFDAFKAQTGFARTLKGLESP